MNQDNNDISEAATLPARPPPVIPCRDPKSDEIFVTLSDIRRPPENSYSNFEGQTQELNEQEREFVASASDSDTDSENSANNKPVGRNKNGALHDAEDEDRVSSLPIVGSLPQESDTSEDSDFVAASFWLRNRLSLKGKEKTDSAEEEAPPVPRRFDSALLRPPQRNRASMDVDDLICKVPDRSSKVSMRRSVSPTLYSLGLAPDVPTAQDTSGANGYAFYDFPKSSVQKQSGNDTKVKAKQKPNGFTNVGVSLIDSCDNHEEYDDDYPAIQSKGKPERHHTQYEDDVGDVYEASWQCTSAAKPDISDKIFEPEKLVVKMPDHNDGKTAVKSRKEEPEGDYLRPKLHVKNVFSKMFSKKHKSKELPDTLEVGRSQNTCSNESDKNDGNFYSDFPLPHQDNHEQKIDSDILKESLANGPKLDLSDSSVELPIRDFGELTNSAHPKPNFSQSMYLTKTSNKPVCDSFNLYEDVGTCTNLSKSVSVRSYSVDLPPSPPPKTGSNEFPQFRKSTSQDIPIAPPRRSKKVPNGGSSAAFDSTSYGVESFGSGAPNRPPAKLPTSPAVKKEPALPPRMSTGSKEESPPPPPRRILTRSDTDVTENKGNTSQYFYIVI